MSLLDTLPDDLAEGVADASDVLLSSLPDTAGDAELSLLLQGLSAEDLAPSEAPLGSAQQQADGAPKAKRRRRARAKPQPDAPPKTRSEIAREAGQARWRKARNRKAPAASSAPAFESATASSSASVVSVPPSQLQLVLSSAGRECSTLCVQHLSSAIPEHFKGKQERKVTNAVKHMSSLSSMALSLKLSRHTIQNKMRLMASTMYLSSSHRQWHAIQSAYYYLQSVAPDFAALTHLLKLRFDEFQMVLRLNEVPKDMPHWLSIARKKERVTAKLEQVTVVHSFLFKANGCHFILECVPKTMLEPIESVHGEVVLTAIESEERGNEWSESVFQDHSRLSISDNHTSNAVTAYRSFMKQWSRALWRWLCSLHAAHRVCDLQWKCFPGDLRGLMATTMAVHGGPNFGKHKFGVKVWYRAKGKRVLKSEVGELPDDAKAYRTKLFSSFLHASDGRLHGPKAKKRHASILRKKHVFTGDLRKLDVVEHLCDGDSCCPSKEHTRQKLDDDIEQEEMPDPWNESRWLGSEEALDYHGFWLGAHGIFIAGFCIGILEITDLDEVQRLIIRWVQGDQESVPETPPSFEECTKEMTPFERRTTHIKNSRQWLESMPMRRLWVLKVPVHTQQDHSKRTLRLSGQEFENRQRQRVAKGEAREYRPVIAFDQVLGDESMREYGQALVSTEAWEVLPVEFHIHSIAMAGFRATSRSICALAELEIFRNRTYPAKYYSSVRDDVEQAVHHAKIIVDDFRRAPCIFCAGSYHYTQKHPTLEAFLSPSHQAQQKQSAMAAELDNAPTESNNGGVRRKVKGRVQQKTIEMQDVNAEWLFKQARQQQASIFGTEDESSSETDGETAMRGGGGGRARGWISLTRNAFKDAKGKVDFAAAHAAYKAEVAHDPNSDALKQAETIGKLGTKATRARFETGETNHDMSVMGTVRPRAEQRQQAIEDEQDILNDFDERVRMANSVVTDGELQLALVNTDPLALVSDLVISRVGGDLKDQVQALDKLSRALAKRDGEEERALLQQIKDAVNKDPQIAGLDFSSIPVPEHSSFELVQDGLPVLRFHDDAFAFAEKKAEQLIDP